MKPCNRCKALKSKRSFSKNARESDGLCRECKDCAKARAKVRYKKEGKKMRAQMAELRKNDYERRLEIERASRKRRKEHQRPAKNARQRLRNKILYGDKFLILPKELKKIYRQPCFNCGSMKNQSMDHIIPLSRGGNHSIGNIMTLCLRCNVSKRDKLLSEWKLKNQDFGGN